MKECSCGFLNENENTCCTNCGRQLSAHNYNDYNSSYNAPPQGNGAATAALVCGIISLFCFGVGVIAICLGVSSYNSLYRANYPTGKSLAGIILGIIGVVGWAIIIFAGLLP